MITKKFLRVAAFVMLISVAMPASSALLSEPVKTNSLANTENPGAEVLIQRLNTIKEMDKSEMTRLEKKGLRKEVKEMKAISGGVYLSVGAIIIIILLLILLL
jgi:hypothetical protein